VVRPAELRAASPVPGGVVRRASHGAVIGTAARDSELAHGQKDQTVVEVDGYEDATGQVGGLAVSVDGQQYEPQEARRLALLLLQAGDRAEELAAAGEGHVPRDAGRRCRVLAGLDEQARRDVDRTERAVALLGALEGAGQALGVDPEDWRAVTSLAAACWDVTR
jgi:hypothetical protein